MSDGPGGFPVIPEDNRILYFGRDRAAFRLFSHFHPAPFEIDGARWPTVEHFYQAQKSLDPTYQRAIAAAAHPSQAKNLAASPDATKTRIREGSWFFQHKKLPRPDWAEVKLDIMRRADFAKFSQNPELGAFLLATCDAELIEDSPSDAFWGTGRNGAGENWAGRVLMEVRAKLAG